MGYYVSITKIKCGTQPLVIKTMNKSKLKFFFPIETGLFFLDLVLTISMLHGGKRVTEYFPNGNEIQKQKNLSSKIAKTT